ncbi:MAG: peptidylprolyl isomerase [Ignavibacteria bacterium]
MKLNRAIFFIICLISFGTTYLIAQSINILQLQDQRIEAAILIKKFNSDFSSSTRKTLLKALANLGDTSSIVINEIVSTFSSNYNDDSIKMIAAFALGQLPCELSRISLQKELQNNNNSSIVLSKIIDALGKIGNSQNLRQLCDFVNDHDFLISQSIALSIGRFYRRNIKTTESVTCLKKLFALQNDSIDYFVAYALSSVRDKSLLKDCQDEIVSLTRSKQYETRMWAYQSLGYILTEEYLLKIIKELGYENLWQVKVNMINAMNLIPKDLLFNNSDLTSKIAEALIRESKNSNYNLRLASIKAISNIFPSVSHKYLREQLLEFLLERIKDETNDYIRGETILALSRVFKDEIKDTLFKLFTTSNIITKYYILISLQFMESFDLLETSTQLVSDYVNAQNELSITKEVAITPSLSKLYGGYLELLNTIKGRVITQSQNKLRLIFTEFLSSKDPYLVDICINALSDSLFLSSRNKTETVLQYDFNELKYPEDRDVIILMVKEFISRSSDKFLPLLQKAISFNDFDICKLIEQSCYKHLVQSLENCTQRTAIDINNLQTLFENNYIAILQTRYGHIKIRLLNKEAPFTVLNFMELSKKGFYDNTIFHRVVPNFVIQGGDPRGNGYGGPPYFIRSEFNNLSFKRGTVGMASDGKDTEGSQFFIMHSPYYHLDGKYTLFGFVEEGEDVIDRIGQGDTLVSVTINYDK